MKYVLLFCGTREQQQAWEDMSEEARNAQYAQVGRWFAENRAKLGSSKQLQSPHTATTVHFQAAGEPIVRDGPFIEGNEVIGGYVEINVADLDEALHLAKTWPARGIIEIRPVMGADQ
ncbi:MAG TPA: YciI family protein [Ktedonobacteraceae bacterium]|nr:YciI family protein [Ktedonobacteraceae bacterium]